MLSGSAVGGSTAWLNAESGRLVRLESTMAAPLTVSRRLKSGETVTISIDCASNLTMELTSASHDPSVADAEALDYEMLDSME
jgi:hypothetical protein